MKDSEYGKRLLIFIGTCAAIILWLALFIGAIVYANTALALFVIFFPLIVMTGVVFIAALTAAFQEFWTWVNDAKR